MRKSSGKQCCHCFEEFDIKLDVCSHCGYEDSVNPESIYLPPGSILAGRYIIGRILGCGSYGATYLSFDTIEKQKRAVKEFMPADFSARTPGQTHVTVFAGDKAALFQESLDEFIQEANRLMQHNTAAAVSVNDVVAGNNTAYIIMEYIEGRTLQQHIESGMKFSADEAAQLFTPVMQSMQYLHRQGIFHRDIAPCNIMITEDGHAKLIDFGSYRYTATTRYRNLSAVIRPGFSPEDQYRSRSDQGAWTDVYALAASIYYAMTGKEPADAMERLRVIEAKKKDILVSPSAYVKKMNKNTTIAILNAMNTRVEDRTPLMELFIQEFTSKSKVVRRYDHTVSARRKKKKAQAVTAASLIALTATVLAVLQLTQIFEIREAANQIIAVIPFFAEDASDADTQHINSDPTPAKLPQDNESAAAPGAVTNPDDEPGISPALPEGTQITANYVIIQDTVYSILLTELILPDSNLTDADIEPLKYMTNLTRLELGINKISDITPLQKLTQLKYLDLSSNKITDISPLSEMTDLNTLYLYDNMISDLSPLGELYALEFLDLDLNRIDNVTPLGGLTGLKRVSLYNNPVADWSSVEHIAYVPGRP